MAGRVYTVEDLLRMIQIVKKDVEYLRGLETKWRGQKSRFPMIYKGIVEQGRALEAKVDKLRHLHVTVEVEELEGMPTQLVGQESLSEAGAGKTTTAKKSKTAVGAGAASAAADETGAKAEDKSRKTPKKAAKGKRRLGVKA